MQKNLINHCRSNLYTREILVETSNKMRFLIAAALIQGLYSLLNNLYIKKIIPDLLQKWWKSYICIFKLNLGSFGVWVDICKDGFSNEYECCKRVGCKIEKKRKKTANRQKAKNEWRTSEAQISVQIQQLRQRTKFKTKNGTKCNWSIKEHFIYHKIPCQKHWFWV